MSFAKRKRPTSLRPSSSSTVDNAELEIGKNDSISSSFLEDSRATSDSKNNKDIDDSSAVVKRRRPTDGVHALGGKSRQNSAKVISDGDGQPTANLSTDKIASSSVKNSDVGSSINEVVLLQEASKKFAPFTEPRLNKKPIKISTSSGNSGNMAGVLLNAPEIQVSSRDLLRACERLERAKLRFVRSLPASSSELDVNYDAMWFC